MKLKTVVIEDESCSREVLSSILKIYCKDDIDLIGQTGTVEEAIKLIKTSNPNLLFLDIKLNADDNGAFTILNALPKKDFSIIFTTGAKQPEKILKALNKYKAIKYLLKPVDIDEVIDGVISAKKQQFNFQSENRINELDEIVDRIKNYRSDMKIMVPVKGGIEYVLAKDIIMFCADINNCQLYLSNNNTIRSTRSLKYFQFNLPKKEFSKVSRKHIVNLFHVSRISTTNGEIISLSNKCIAPLKPMFKKDFYNNLSLIHK